MPFRDVEQDDVAEFLQADQVGERAADLAGADERDLVTSHGGSILQERGAACKGRRWGLFSPENRDASTRGVVKSQGFEPLEGPFRPEADPGHPRKVQGREGLTGGGGPPDRPEQSCYKKRIL
jgi:hypothetical protein